MYAERARNQVLANTFAITLFVLTEITRISVQSVYIYLRVLAFAHLQPNAFSTDSRQISRYSQQLEFRDCASSEYPFSLFFFFKTPCANYLVVTVTTRSEVLCTVGQ